jgi:hypothetical protein
LPLHNSWYGLGVVSCNVFFTHENILKLVLEPYESCTIKLTSGITFENSSLYNLLLPHHETVTFISNFQNMCQN